MKALEARAVGIKVTARLACAIMIEVISINSFFQTIMSDLKTHLYAKFGDAINLEADE